jgi:putative phage-type endonuclease
MSYYYKLAQIQIDQFKNDEKLNNYIKCRIGKTNHHVSNNLLAQCRRAQTSLGLTLSKYIDMYKKPFITPKFKTIEEKESYYRLWCDMIHIPKDYRNVWRQYKYIEEQPQTEQKSQEWLDERQKYITASSGAEAISESKYKTRESFARDKAGLGIPFKENANVWHGKKSETIATSIFEEDFNVKVGEFGLIPHLRKDKKDVIPFLGASPDGIATCCSMDGKFSDYVGRMLEIKCVTSRQINDTGPEHIFKYTEKKDPGIVPHYYWIQIQLQLECCNLELCDFWQCKLRDYWSKRLLDEAVRKYGKSTHCREQGVPHIMNPNLETGVYVELLPKDTSKIPKDEKVMWYGKYIYPHNMSEHMNDKIEWALHMKENWKTIYPQYVKDYEFGKLIFYHLEKSHCYLVRRDQDWFKEALPRFKEFWDMVLLYRHDKETRDRIIEEIAQKEIEKLAKAERKRKFTNDINLESDED